MAQFLESLAEGPSSRNENMNNNIAAADDGGSDGSSSHEGLVAEDESQHQGGDSEDEDDEVWAGFYDFNAMEYVTNMTDTDEEIDPLLEALSEIQSAFCELVEWNSQFNHPPYYTFKQYLTDGLAEEGYTIQQAQELVQRIQGGNAPWQ